MRCLTILQPYASAIVAGVKAPETRLARAAQPDRHLGGHPRRGLALPGRQARGLHTIPLWDGPAMWPACRALADLPRGAIVCVARLVRSVRVEDYRT
jgi:hypothetical protein